MAGRYLRSSYGSARTYSDLLSDKEGATLLQQTLDEEGATDKKLTKLARTVVNLQAESVPSRR